MIIDTHVHIGKMLVFDMPPENVLYSIDKYGIDFSLVSNVECAENDHNGTPIPQSIQKSQNAVLKKTLEFASAIIVGRSIYESDNPALACEKIIKD